MRIDCPACAAAYDVPEGLLAPGRPVRCNRCGESWVPHPATTSARSAPLQPAPAGPPPEPAIPSPPAPPPPGFPPPPRPPLKTGLPALRSQPVRRPGWTAPVLAWILSLALVGGGLAALWHYRQEAVAAWPPLAHLLRLVAG